MMRFNGGAVGYLSYESVGYFEELPTPETVIIDVPESVFMLTMTYLVFDHIGHTISVVSHAHLDGDVEAAYSAATARIDDLIARLRAPMDIPTPSQSAADQKLAPPHPT